MYRRIILPSTLLVVACQPGMAEVPGREQSPEDPGSIAAPLPAAMTETTRDSDDTSTTTAGSPPLKYNGRVLTRGVKNIW